MIRFRIEPGGNGTTDVQAEIRLSAGIKINSYAMYDQSAAIADAKKVLVLTLARKLYEDRSRELHIALVDLMRSTPMLSVQTMQACDRVVALAKAQPDATIDALMNSAYSLD